MYFAQSKGNYEMIITHHINEEEYEEAIQKIEFVKTDRVKKIIYRYAHILMKEKPCTD